MFTTPAFIQNSNEAANWLLDLGYICTSKRQDLKWLITYIDGCKAFYKTAKTKPAYNCHQINCAYNLRLFKAISILQDDTDAGQLFVYDNNWFECNHCSIEQLRLEMLESCKDAWLHKSHKATPTELSILFTNILIADERKLKKKPVI